MRLDDYIRLAISVGQFENTSNIFDGIDLKAVYESLFAYSCLQGTHSFDDLCDGLSNPELIGFFIGEVLIEDSISPEGNGIGSTTPTKFIYRILRQKHLDEDSFLGNWAYRFSMNEYVPYDGSSYYLNDVSVCEKVLYKSKTHHDQLVLLEDYRYRHPLFYFYIKSLDLSPGSVEYLINGWEYVQTKKHSCFKDQVAHFINLLKWQRRTKWVFLLSNEEEIAVVGRIQSIID